MLTCMITFAGKFMSDGKINLKVLMKDTIKYIFITFYAKTSYTHLKLHLHLIDFWQPPEKMI